MNSEELTALANSLEARYGHAFTRSVGGIVVGQLYDWSSHPSVGKAVDALRTQAAQMAPQEAAAEGALRELDKRLRECAALPITAAEAYDSFFQQMVAAALSAAPQAQEDARDAGLREFLAAWADSEYVKGANFAKQDACKGEEFKLRKGLFGEPELAAHRRMNEHFGAHFSIYAALKQFDASTSATAQSKEPT